MDFIGGSRKSIWEGFNRTGRRPSTSSNGMFGKFLINIANFREGDRIPAVPPRTTTPVCSASACPPVYLSTHPSIYPPTRLSIHPPVYLSTHPSIYPPTRLSIHLPARCLVCSPTDRSVYPFLQPSIHLSVCPCIHCFIHLFSIH